MENGVLGNLANSYPLLFVKELPWMSTELRGIYLNTICADL
jgi:hypothetical protein